MTKIRPLIPTLSICASATVASLIIHITQRDEDIAVDDGTAEAMQVTIGQHPTGDLDADAAPPAGDNDVDDNGDDSVRADDDSGGVVSSVVAAPTFGSATSAGSESLLVKSHMGHVTRLLHESDALKPEHVAPLEAALPEDLQGFDWPLLYSLSRDGPSFETFYECVKGQASTLIVVNTAAGECFGAYASEVWKASEQYFGADDCFLFSFAIGGEFHKYKCSGANKFFQLAHDVSATHACCSDQTLP